MPEPANMRHMMSANQKLLFVIKGLVLVGLLAVVARWAAALPPLVIALVWAGLSLLSALGIVYHDVIRKTHKQFMYKDGGSLSRLNGGRVLRMVIAYVVSAALIASLILAAPKWSLAEWLILLCAIPVYLLVYELLSIKISGEYEPLYRTSRITRAASIAIGILLCAVYAVYLAVSSQLASVYETPLKAFIEISQPFLGSRSALLYEAGYLSSITDAVTMYAMSKAGEVISWAPIIWELVLEASAFFGFASLLGFLSLRVNEVKRIFRPLESAKNPHANRLVLKRYVVVACVLPVALVAGFAYADFKAVQAIESQELTLANKLMRDIVGIRIDVVDGKKYDPVFIDEVTVETAAKAGKLNAVARSDLGSMIAEIYQTRADNVDKYLDWYYSFPSGVDRARWFFEGGGEDALRAKLEETIDDGVDYAAFETRLQQAIAEADVLETGYREAIAANEIAGVPDGLVLDVDERDSGTFEAPLAPIRWLLDSETAADISIGTDLAGLEKMNALVVLDVPFFGLDRLINRESHKEQLLNALDSSRIELLATLAGL